MKFFVLLAALISFSACASKDKMDDSANEMKKDAQEMATSAEDSAKEEMKKAEEKMEEKKMAAKSESMMSGESIKKIACSLDKDERVINIEKTAEGGCQVLYTKFGNTNSIATAASDVSYCEGVGQKVTGNLENAGFTCDQ